jgi:uncharacterized lipoprotein YbaY
MMDDNRSLEDRVATELGQMAGPEPPVDALAVARSAAEHASKRRSSTMFSATKFVLAGAIVALFGGFLFASVLTTREGEQPVPGAEASASAVAQVSGMVNSGALDQPQRAVRIVVTLEDALAPEAGTPPLGEAIFEGANYGDGTFEFSIDYDPERIVDSGSYVLKTRMEESEVLRLVAVGTDPGTGETAVPVITNGNPVEGIEIELIKATDDGTIGYVGGRVIADSGLPATESDMRMVVTLSDSSASGPAAVVGEFVVEGPIRLVPARFFAVEYELGSIDEAGDYAMEVRLEDAATGALLGASDTPIPVITNGNPVESVLIDLKPVVESDEG